MTRLVRAKQLLHNYPQSKVHFIWFTDEKLFTVAAPKNAQNDRLYVPAGIRKKQVSAARLLQTRSTFTKSVMVSVGVSSLGATELIFIDPGVKINGDYYRNVLLSQQLCQPSERCQAIFLSFNRTALLLIVHLMIRCCSSIHLCSSLRRCGRRIVQTSTQWTTRYGMYFRSECTR